MACCTTLPYASFTALQPAVRSIDINLKDARLLSDNYRENLQNGKRAPVTEQKKMNLRKAAAVGGCTVLILMAFHVYYGNKIFF